MSSKVTLEHCQLLAVQVRKLWELLPRTPASEREYLLTELGRFIQVQEKKLTSKPLVIPKGLSPKWKYAAMDKNKRVWVYTDMPILASIGWDCQADTLAMNDMFDIDTRGVDWKSSLIKL